MTKTAETKTVKCPIHKIEFPVSTCLARQKIVAEAPISGIKGEAYKRFKESCGGCKIGLELYSEANKTAEIKPIQDERVQVHTKEPETPLKPSKNDSSEKESKTCPCGKDFFRQPEQNDVSWAVCKYCPECAGMTAYLRKKKFSAKAAQNVDEAPVPAMGKETSHEKHESSGEFKVCELEGCGKKFFKVDTSDGSWRMKKYCSKECKKKAESSRESVRKKSYRKKVAIAKVFDELEAEVIARNATEKNLKLLTPFIENAQLFDQLRALAIQVGIDSQRSAHDAAWAS